MLKLANLTSSVEYLVAVIAKGIKVQGPPRRAMIARISIFERLREMVNMLKEVEAVIQDECVVLVVWA